MMYVWMAISAMHAASIIHAVIDRGVSDPYVHGALAGAWLAYAIRMVFADKGGRSR